MCLKLALHMYYNNNILFDKDMYQDKAIIKATYLVALIILSITNNLIFLLLHKFKKMSALVRHSKTGIYIQQLSIRFSRSFWLTLVHDFVFFNVNVLIRMVRWRVVTSSVYRCHLAHETPDLVEVTLLLGTLTLGTVYNGGRV